MVHGYESGGVMRCNSLKVFVLSVVVFAAFAVAGQPAKAVTVLFTGNGASGGTGQGIIGHDAVSGASIAHMSSLYSAVGIANVYTRLSSPDAYDFSTGGELAIGANAPARSFAATASASGALASVGINGSLHIGLRGFTLNTSGDAASLVDLSFSGLNESRIYRNGEVAIFEETAPNVFNEVAAYTDGTFSIDIDYSTGVITNTFNGTLSPGSMTIFPETWTGTSFDPIDLAGSTPEIYGAFSVTTTLEVSEPQVSVPEPGMPAIIGLGLIAFAAYRRRAI